MCALNGGLLESDYGIIQLPGDLEWLGFREVLPVDGKPVPDSAHRLAEIFAVTVRLKPDTTKGAETTRGAGATASLSQARRIAEESARYNVGPIYRTINDPSFVLEFLDGRNGHRMRFSKNGEETVGDSPRVGHQISGNGSPDDHPDTRSSRINLRRGGHGSILPRAGFFGPRRPSSRGSAPVTSSARSMSRSRRTTSSGLPCPRR